MLRKHMIEASFARRVGSYEDHADVQARVSARLASLLPPVDDGDVLELGCGTGLFTRQLVGRMPSCRFLITDYSEEMVRAASGKFAGEPRLAFDTMDGDQLALARRFDVVASSMALHWFDDPVSSLSRQQKLLKRNGRVVFATLGPDNFPQWRETLAALGFDNGTISLPQLPGVVSEERISIDYGSARDFLASMKKTGATMARTGYRPISSPALNRVCDAFDERFGGTVSWHIVYGVLEA